MGSLVLLLTSETAVRGDTLPQSLFAPKPCPDCNCCALCDTVAECSGGAASCGEPCGSALLDFSTSLTNFADVALANDFYGWNNETLGGSCTWSGITCQDELLSIDLSNLWLEGAA